MKKNLINLSTKENLQNSKFISTISRGEQAAFLDWQSMTKAAQSITRELDVKRLIKRILEITIENTGARIGYLLSATENRHRVLAKAVLADGPEGNVVKSAPNRQQTLPDCLLRYVRRTRKTVVLSDAQQSVRFGNDPYFKGTKARSVLCMPMIHQNRLIGVLYLENRLATDVFTHQRLEILKFLMSQAAVAMHNAVLFRKLNKSLAEAKQREHFIQRALNAIPGLVYIYDLRKRKNVFVFSKLKGSLKLEFSTERLLSMEAEQLESFVHPEDLPAVREHLRRIKACTDNQVSEIDWRIPDMRGEWHAMRSYNTVFDRDSKGRGIRILGIAIDVHEQKMLEEQLRQSQKMDALGQLAGGVAHDFNNQLTLIMYHAELLRLSLADSKDFKFAKGIADSAERCRKLTESLLNFSRKESARKIKTDVHQILAEVAEILGRTLEKRITIKQDLRASCAIAQGDPASLHNVFLNLGINARDAMPEGGTLSFETNVMATDNIAAIPDLQMETESGELLRIRVKDTGFGMDEHTLKHVFEPFFTTKEAGKGTGLGLATVYRIIQQHKGSIEVQSMPGRGTCFTIYLPVEKRDA